MKVRQELHCHNCNQYVQFTMDMALNGNHVINCPECGHEHCRVVEDGVITDDRWDSRNGATDTGAYIATSVTNSSTSTYTHYADSGTSGSTTTNYIMYQSWMNTVQTS